jgi:hypothetical protein
MAFTAFSPPTNELEDDDDKDSFGLGVFNGVGRVMLLFMLTLSSMVEFIVLTFRLVVGFVAAWMAAFFA